MTTANHNFYGKAKFLAVKHCGVCGHKTFRAIKIVQFTRMVTYQCDHCGFANTEVVPFVPLQGDQK